MADGLTLIGPPLAPPVELMRWLMQVHRVKHRYRPRAAGLSAFESRKHKVPVELPLLLTPAGPVGGLKPSLVALEALLPAGAALYPEAGDREFVDDLATRLFGPAVKCFYQPMLRVPPTLIPSSIAGQPQWDRFVVARLYPVWRWVMRRGLKLDAFDAGAAAGEIEGIFEQVAKSLVDGRTDLAAGIRDIVFAVLASPVLLPPGHPAVLPPDTSLPPAFLALVERLRAHRAGAHALKTYRAHRAA